MVKHFSLETRQKISNKLKGRPTWNKYYSDKPCYACGSLITYKSKKRDMWYPNHDDDKNRICGRCYQYIWIKRLTGLVSREKIKIINHYSNGTNKCNCCGENHIEFLSVDHINGGGARHRKEVKNLYAWIIKNNFPLGFQVLCMNCNHAKGHYNQCPHMKEVILI